MTVLFRTDEIGGSDREFPPKRTDQKFEIELIKNVPCSVRTSLRLLETTDTSRE